MDIQQTLMDISTSVDYIKKHLESGGACIGGMDLEGLSAQINSLLKQQSVQEGGKSLQSYQAILAPAVERLDEVVKKLDESQTAWREGLSGLQDAAGEYTQTLNMAVAREIKHQEEHREMFGVMAENMESVKTMLLDMQKHRDEGQQFTKLQDQISEMTQKDAHARCAYSENSTRLRKLAEEISESYQSLNERLEQATASYKETAGRLENLLSQMEGNKKWKRR